MCTLVWIAQALLPGQTDGAADRTLTESVVVLERAVSALASPSADYTKVMRGVLSAWPVDGQGFVKTDIAAFLSRAPGPRDDFRCGADFLRHRARRELRRLKDAVLDANPLPTQPQFCAAVPFAIDPSRAPGAVEIYGYDFDREPVVQLLLMDDFGFQDVTFAVIRRAHYHLTLDLATNGLRFTSDNQRLALTVGHVIEHAIAVIQQNTPLCDSRVEETTAGKTITYAPPLLKFRGGFSGSGAAVVGNATLDYDSNSLDATVCMTAAEPTGHRRASSGCALESAYATESDRVIEGVVGMLDDQVAYIHRAQSEDVRKGADRGPVDRWVFGGLSGPAVAALEPRVTIQLRPIRLISTKIDRCVSPIDYLEARRTFALEAATVRRLDPQLQKVDPTVLKARPRFALR